MIFGVASFGDYNSTLFSTVASYGCVGYRGLFDKLIGNNASTLISDGFTHFVANLAWGNTDNFSSDATSVLNWLATLPNNFPFTQLSISIANEPQGTWTYQQYVSALQTLWKALNNISGGNGTNWGTTSGGKGVRIAAPCIAYTQTGMTFLQNCMSNGAKGYFDLVEIHVYPNDYNGQNLTSGGPLTNTGDPYYNKGASGYLDDAYYAAGSKPMIITEFNITGGNNSYSGTTSTAPTDQTSLVRLFYNKGYVQEIYWFADVGNFGDTCGSGTYPYPLLESNSSYTNITSCMASNYKTLAQTYGSNNGTLSFTISPTVGGGGTVITWTLTNGPISTNVYTNAFGSNSGNTATSSSGGASGSITVPSGQASGSYNISLYLSSDNTLLAQANFTVPSTALYLLMSSTGTLSYTSSAGTFKTRSSTLNVVYTSASGTYLARKNNGVVDYEAFTP